MQCQICGKRPAVVHFTEIVNNKKSEYHVCEKCAEEKGYHVPLVKTKFSVGDLLAGMVEQPGSAEEARVGRVQCPKCGLVYSNFKETGRLGCSECYPTFRSQLRPLLRRVRSDPRAATIPPAGRAPRWRTTGPDRASPPRAARAVARCRPGRCG